jgi:hypothetical protein
MTWIMYGGCRYEHIFNLEPNIRLGRYILRSSVQMLLLNYIQSQS